MVAFKTLRTHRFVNTKPSKTLIDGDKLMFAPSTAASKLLLQVSARDKNSSKTFVVLRDYRDYITRVAA
jgi:hypothetical protein